MSSTDQDEFNHVLAQRSTLEKYIRQFISNYLKTGDKNRTLGFTQARKTLLESYWEKYSTWHSTICSLAEELGDDAKNNSYFIDDIYSTIEVAYCEALGYLNDVIASHSRHDTKPRETSDGAPSGSSISPSVIINQSPLPTIELNRFTGNYVEWPVFKDMFRSLIMENPFITSDTQRLQYLKTYLSGDAERLLRNISVTEANFKGAWKILEERYENKKILVNALLKSLTSISAASSESNSELKRIVDGTIDTLKALENLGRPVTHWDDWIIFITVQKLDRRTRLQWENSISEKDFEKITFRTLKSFLENKIRALDSVAVMAEEPGNNKTKTVKPSSSSIPGRKAHISTSRRKCVLCSDNHYILFCPNFRQSTIEERRATVSRQQLCYNCLSGDHTVKACSNPKRCQVCKSKHHTMLHQDANINASIASTSSNTNDSTNSVLVSSHAPNQRSTNKTVLLATALVLLRTKAGKEVRARALLDQGSEATFLSSSLQQRLGIKGTKSYIPIAGIGSVDAGIARQRVWLELLSLVEPEFALVFEALVLPKLTSVLLAQTIELSKWTHIQNLPLADPEFYKSQKIDLILGADVYAQLIQSDIVHGPAGTPTARKTHLGWLLTGIVQNPLPIKETRRFLHGARQEDLSGIITKFWEMEEVPSAPSLTDEEECIKIYEELPDGISLVATVYGYHENLRQLRA